MAAPAVIQEEIREVLDTETGLVNRVRTTRVGIPDGEGGLVVAEATSAVTARVMGTERDGESPERATERTPLIQRPESQPAQQRRRRQTREGRPEKIFRFCFLPFFIPCTCNRFWCLGLLTFVFCAVTTFAVIITGLGPLQSCGFYFHVTSIIILALLSVIIILSCLCVCFSCIREENLADYRDSKCRSCQMHLFFIACYFGMVFLVLLSVASAYIITEYQKYSIFGECKGSVGLLMALYFSYALLGYFVLGWCVVAYRQLNELMK